MCHRFLPRSRVRRVIHDSSPESNHVGHGVAKEPPLPLIPDIQIARFVERRNRLADLASGAVIAGSEGENVSFKAKFTID